MSGLGWVIWLLARVTTLITGHWRRLYNIQVFLFVAMKRNVRLMFIYILSITSRLLTNNGFYRTTENNPNSSTHVVLVKKRRNMIEIWPIDALFEVLGFITFSIYVVFKFEWDSNWSDIPFLVTFHFVWHLIFNEIYFWVTFHFEWYFILSEWHFILCDIPF